MREGLARWPPGGRRTGLPTYEFRCGKCRKKVTLSLTVGEYENKKYKCTKCGSKSLQRLVTTFQVQTSKKS